MLKGLVPRSLKTWFARISRSRVTRAFFLFVLVNCVVQTALHARFFVHFTQGRDLVSGAIDAAGIQRGITVFRDGALEICFGVPTAQSTACHVVYNHSSAHPLPPPPPPSRPPPPSQPPPPPPGSAPSTRCAEGLTWLENHLQNYRSEEVVYLVLQIWLFVISFHALIDESIPNLVVVIAAQIMNTGWIAYHIVNDLSTKETHSAVVVNGTCGGFNIIGEPWEQPTFHATLACSVVALLGTTFFAIKLAMLYLKGTLSVIGSPSPVIDRMKMWRLWMRVSLQSTTFSVISSAAVWYDKRKNGMGGPSPANQLQDAGFCIMILITISWLMLGMYSVSKENRLLFFVYVLLNIGLLIISGLWFASELFLYEFKTWRLFASVTTLADAMLVVTCILSIICRLNFGKGLARFLVVERTLQASGFPCDVFLHGSGRPPSRPAVHIPGGFLLAPGPKSADSAVSPTVEAWLATHSAKEWPKSPLDSLGQERPTSILVVCRENSSLWDVEGVIDDEGDIGSAESF